MLAVLSYFPAAQLMPRASLWLLRSRFGLTRLMPRRWLSCPGSCHGSCRAKGLGLGDRVMPGGPGGLLQPFTWRTTMASLQATRQLHAWGFYLIWEGLYEQLEVPVLLYKNLLQTC